MQSRTNIMKDGKIVMASYNLRAILDYAREHPVTLMHIFKESDGRGYLHIVFFDGATCDTYFSDYTGLQIWCKLRMIHNENFAGCDYSEQ